jgi:hypothetical protein
MTDMLTEYMHRAGIASRRELARLTGIAHSTLDDIFAHPMTARGYQLQSIADACGMTSTDIGELILRGGQA